MSDRRRLPVPQSWWRRIAWRNVIGGLLIVVAAYSAGETYHAGEVLQEQAECQANVNEQFLTALRAIDVAQRATSDAQRRLLTANTRGDVSAGLRARDEYLHALDVLDQTRTQTPLPGATRC